MSTLQELESEVNRIEERNKKVELDKAWETSWTRKILVAFLTYLVISIFFYYAGLNEPFKSAVVPTLGFLLSTLSVPFFKNLWLNHIYKK